jgi:Spy/CpxP family protein refolding chaperone
MKPTWKIAALLAAIVLLSGFTGYYFGFQVAKAKARARSNPDSWNVSAMKTLERKLKLTPAQHEKVQAILDSGVDELRGIRIDTIAKSNRVLERLIAEVGNELTPEQREEFAKLKAERIQANLDMLKVEPRKK